mgnify:CR=1 FL=1
MQPVIVFGGRAVQPLFKVFGVLTVDVAGGLRAANALGITPENVDDLVEVVKRIS